MNVQKIREKLQSYKGKTINFKFNGSRNQIEEFQGMIENVYNYVFTIKLKDNDNVRKSFSYVDVLTDSLEIDVF